VLAIMVTATLAAPLRAASGADAEAGRALVKRYADAIVGVELVVTLKVKVGDREQPPRERRIETNGTVISPDGLTVASLAEVDPQTTFEAMRASGAARGAELLGAEFKEVKLRLANGKEVPARFVLKDADLDLAFMAPDVAADEEKPTFPSYVKLDEATEGTVLDTFYYVGRAPKVLQRVPLVRTSEVMGVVEKPRRFYLMTDLRLGSPMFDAKGRVLGITLQNFASGLQTGYVVLPSADIAEIAKQAAAIQAQPKPVELPKPVDIPAKAEVEATAP
jgi:S1-C subfamily serine protease